MSYNKNYNDNFQGNTFHNAPQFFPPPPPPPAFFMPPQIPRDVHDASFVKKFESRIPIQKAKLKTSSISAVRDEISKLLLMLKKLHNQTDMLSKNLEELLDEEWNSNYQHNEDSILKIVENLRSLNLVVLQKKVTKRLKKRARLKRLHMERKKEKEEWIKEMQEKSRKIDEKLQKEKDDILKSIQVCYYFVQGILIKLKSYVPSG